MTYRDEADALDARILDVIARWNAGHDYGSAWEFGDDEFPLDFNTLALDIFEHQLRYNEPYAKYCATFGVALDKMPTSWEDIPAIPTAAYKEAALATFDPQKAALVFQTSGTTVGQSGLHYMENALLYDEALSAGFTSVFSVEAHHRFLLLVPNPAERPTSSLGYMMGKVAQMSDEPPRWLIREDVLDIERFIEEVREARKSEKPLFIASTAFALVQVLDEFEKCGITSLPLPSGSFIMETGGFKGKTRVVDRGTLYEMLSRTFSLGYHKIIAEYGMTELTSQYYDWRMGIPDDPAQARIKVSPPWLRPRVVGPNGRTLPKGVVGALVHVDLANRSSCIAVQTEDLGAEMDGGIILLGREQGAELRGCSLDAESLRAARA